MGQDWRKRNQTYVAYKIKKKKRECLEPARPESSLYLHLLIDVSWIIHPAGALSAYCVLGHSSEHRMIVYLPFSHLHRIPSLVLCSQAGSSGPSHLCLTCTMNKSPFRGDGCHGINGRNPACVLSALYLQRHLNYDQDGLLTSPSYMRRPYFGGSNVKKIHGIIKHIFT